MVLRRWLLIEKLMIIWLFDSLVITCPNLSYHKFLQKLRKETILSSSLWYVRILLGLLVRIFSMSVLLYNKFSLETPFLLLTALTWLLISAQAVPLPVISFLISISRPSPTKSYPYFSQNVKYRNKHLFGQNQFSLVKSGCFVKSQATRKMSENATKCWRDNKFVGPHLVKLRKSLLKIK